ncbi:TetR/AcrR family transcriptional regulator [Pararhizobium mangrovi]|nr:TetR/AcrR family transcriptional regulator [Pararhizobium mangrovi]
MNSISQRHGRMRTKVLEAAYDLFAQQGFEPTTMADIATASGVARRTLFRHFGGKEGIALAYQDTILDDLMVRLAETLEMERPDRALAHAVLSFVDEMPRQRALDLSNLLVENPNLRARNLEKYAAIESAAAAMISPHLGAGKTLEARIIAATVIGAWRIVNERWLEGDRQSHPGAELRRAFDVMRFESG